MCPVFFPLGVEVWVSLGPGPPGALLNSPLGESTAPHRIFEDRMNPVSSILLILPPKGVSHSSTRTKLVSQGAQALPVPSPLPVPSGADSIPFTTHQVPGASPGT